MSPRHGAWPPRWWVAGGKKDEKAVANNKRIREC